MSKNENIMKLQKRANLFKWIGFIIVMAIFAPVAISGILGLTGIAAFAVLAMAISNFLPYIAMKLANLSMAAMRNEAKRNPIETLYVTLQQNRDKVAAQITATEEFGRDVKNFEAQVTQMEREFPEDAKAYRQHFQTMQDLLSHRYEDIKVAQKNITAFEREIRRAETLWNMSQSANRLTKISSSVEDRFAEIKTQTALDSIEENMNASIASLQHDMRMKSIEMSNDSGIVIETVLQGNEYVKR